jgi:hypothetical protein
MANFSFRPFGTPCISNNFPLSPPHEISPLHWLGVSSYPLPFVRKSTCILVDVFVVVCFCVATDLYFFDLL